MDNLPLCGIKIDNCIIIKLDLLESLEHYKK